MVGIGEEPAGDVRVGGREAEGGAQLRGDLLDEGEVGGGVGREHDEFDVERGRRGCVGLLGERVEWRRGEIRASRAGAGMAGLDVWYNLRFGLMREKGGRNTDGFVLYCTLWGTVQRPNTVRSEPMRCEGMSLTLIGLDVDSAVQ